jgi:hypothetical protein
MSLRSMATVRNRPLGLAVVEPHQALLQCVEDRIDAHARSFGGGTMRLSAWNSAAGLLRPTLSMNSLHPSRPVPSLPMLAAASRKQRLMSSALWSLFGVPLARRAVALCLGANWPLDQDEMEISLQSCSRGRRNPDLRRP